MEKRVRARARHGFFLPLFATLRNAARLLALLVIIAPPCLAITGPSSYVYDDLGRLIQVIASDGSSVQYAYDAAGNLVGIKNNAINTVSISGFTPNIGNIGTVVTLQGSGFSTTPSANTVQFNGQAATVTAATANTLTVTVPSGATTGTLSVSNSNGSATSLGSFTVGINNPPPTISGFTPAIVSTGSAVTVTGTGFQTNPATNNKILIAGARGTVTAATATSVTFTAPASTGGLISLITPYGQTSSASSLLIVPSTINAADVVQATALNIDGTTTNISLPAGKVGVYTFEGTAGQAVGLALSNYVSSPSGGSVTMSVITPQGATLVLCEAGNVSSYNKTAGCADLNFFPTTLPMAGLYQVIVKADSTHASTATLTFSTQPLGTLTADAAPTTIVVSRIGQAPRYTFTATAGQDLNLVWSGSTLSSVSGDTADLFVFAPDGTQLANPRIDTAVANGYLALKNLSQTGIYTALIWPPISAGTTGQIALKLTSSATGALVVNGTPTAISLTAGQQGIYTFEGTLGQSVGLAVSSFSSSPSGGSLAISIVDPYGTTIASCSSINATKGCTGLNNAPGLSLRSSGTYKVVVQGSATHANTATLTLSTSPSGTLTLDASATAATSTRLGQMPRYTFSGTAGQTVNLVWTSSTYAASSYLHVFNPDGTELMSAKRADTGTNPSSTQTLVLTQTGDYLVYLLPANTGAATGTLNLQLKSQATGALNLDGAATSISLSAGRQGIYTFEGTAGQSVGFALNGFSSSPSGGNMTVSLINPRGDTIISCGTYTGTNGCSALSAAPGYKLPITGTYKVLVQGSSPHTVAATLTLSSHPSGTLPLDAAAIAATATRAGQAPRYTFTGTAGDTVSLVWSGSTYTASTNLYAYNPDGTVLMAAKRADTASGASNAQTLALTQTGTYLVYLLPAGAASSTGTLNLQLKSPASDTLNVDGTATSISLSAGRQGIYTFAGSAGQSIGLALSGYSSSPSGGSATIKLISPEGTTIADCGTFTGTNGCSALAAAPGYKLPSTGTYKVIVQASATHAISGTLTLSTFPSDTLTVDAAAIAATTNRLGQALRYTFDGTAGQILNLIWSGSTYTASTNLYAYNPDGTVLMAAMRADTASGASGTQTLTLNQTGSYLIYLLPASSASALGSVDLQLTTQGSTTPPSYTPTGSLTLDGTPTSISLSAGQVGRYTFDGTVGQSVGLALSGYSSSPAGGNVTISIVSPQGVTLGNCDGAISATKGCPFLNNPPGYKLPSTGTYQIVVQADATHASTATLTLSSSPTGTLSAGDPAITVTVNRLGQSPRYTFSGTAGQTMNISWSNSTFPSNTYLYVYNPDGSALVSTQNVDTTNPGGSRLLTLGQTGTYLVYILPKGWASYTGTLNLQLKDQATGALVMDGTPTNISLSSGQQGTYTFAGSAGQYIGLSVSNYVSTPSGGNISVKLISPQGVVTDCGSFTGLKGCEPINSPPGFYLKSAGTYQVVVQADGDHAITATLTLSASPTGTLTVDAGPVSVASTRVAQSPRYFFSGTAGQRMSLTWGDSTYPTNTYLYVYNPDGTELVATQNVDASNPQGSRLLLLEQTGNYLVYILPKTWGAYTGSVNLELKSQVTGSLDLDGTPTAINLSRGQRGIYSFSGTAGQAIGMSVSDYVGTPSGGSVSLDLFSPEGELVAACGSFTALKGCEPINNPPGFTLKSTGTYRLVALAGGDHASAANVTLSTPITGTLTVDGPPVAATTTRIAQTLRYTFTGTANQAVNLVWTDSTYPGTTYFSVYQPDGSALISQQRADTGAGVSGSVRLYLTQTGTYTVYILPKGWGSYTGTMNLQLKSPLYDSITLDGAVESISLTAGQSGRLTFEGTVGQKLKLQTANVVTTPSGGAVSISVLSPEGVEVGSCSSSNATALWLNCNLTPLPSTGTYRIFVNASYRAATFDLSVSPLNFAGQ